MTDVLVSMGYLHEKREPKLILAWLQLLSQRTATNPVTSRLAQTRRDDRFAGHPGLSFVPEHEHCLVRDANDHAPFVS
jgi:hypothetical protein